MDKKRSRRHLKVDEVYARGPSIPTLAQIQAEAAPIIALLLAQSMRKRYQSTSPTHSPSVKRSA